MIEIRHLAELVTEIIEAVGVVVILLGLLVAVARAALGAVRGATAREEFMTLRGDIGRAVLLGLDFLVAADIIGTVAVESTLESVAVLGILVVIRTFLSFAIEVEITGRWPWQGEGLAPRGPSSR